MKTHLPVKLRAALLAALVSVSALAYNASAADGVAQDTPGAIEQTPSVEETPATWEGTAGTWFTANNGVSYIQAPGEDGQSAPLWVPADGKLVLVGNGGSLTVDGDQRVGDLTVNQADGERAEAYVLEGEESSVTVSGTLTVESGRLTVENELVLSGAIVLNGGVLDLSAASLKAASLEQFEKQGDVDVSMMGGDIEGCGYQVTTQAYTLLTVGGAGKVVGQGIVPVLGDEYPESFTQNQILTIGDDSLTVEFVHSVDAESGDFTTQSGIFTKTECDYIYHINGEGTVQHYVSDANVLDADETKSIELNGGTTLVLNGALNENCSSIDVTADAELFLEGANSIAYGKLNVGEGATLTIAGTGTLELRGSALDAEEDAPTVDLSQNVHFASTQLLEDADTVVTPNLSIEGKFGSVNTGNASGQVMVGTTTLQNLTSAAAIVIDEGETLSVSGTLQMNQELTCNGHLLLGEGAELRADSLDVFTSAVTSVELRDGEQIGSGYTYTYKDYTIISGTGSVTTGRLQEGDEANAYLADMTVGDVKYEISFAVDGETGEGLADGKITGVVECDYIYHINGEDTVLDYVSDTNSLDADATKSIELNGATLVLNGALNENCAGVDVTQDSVLHLEGANSIAYGKLNVAEGATLTVSGTGTLELHGSEDAPTVDLSQNVHFASTSLLEDAGTVVTPNLSIEGQFGSVDTGNASGKLQLVGNVTADSLLTETAIDLGNHTLTINNSALAVDNALVLSGNKGSITLNADLTEADFPSMLDDGLMPLIGVNELVCAGGTRLDLTLSATTLETITYNLFSQTVMPLEGEEQAAELPSYILMGIGSLSGAESADLIYTLNGCDRIPVIAADEDAHLAVDGKPGFGLAIKTDENGNAVLQLIDLAAPAHGDALHGDAGAKYEDSHLTVSAEDEVNFTGSLTGESSLTNEGTLNMIGAVVKAPVTNSGNLTITEGTEITGTVVSTAGTVEVSGSQVDSMAVAGTELTISNTEIADAVSTTGGTVDIADSTMGSLTTTNSTDVSVTGATITGAVSTTGGTVDIAGSTMGSLTTTNSEDVSVTGATIADAVSTTGGTVDIAGSTMGSLTTTNSTDVTVTGATIAGAVSTTGGTVSIADTTADRLMSTGSEVTVSGASDIKHVAVVEGALKDSSSQTAYGALALSGGALELTHKDSVTVGTLQLDANSTLSVSTDGTPAPESEAELTVGNAAILANGAKLNADLKLTSGAELRVQGSGKGASGVVMGSDVNLSTGTVLGGDAVTAMAGKSVEYVLFSSADALNVDGAGVSKVMADTVFTQNAALAKKYQLREDNGTISLRFKAEALAPVATNANQAAVAAVLDSLDTPTADGSKMQQLLIHLDNLHDVSGAAAAAHLQAASGASLTIAQLAMMDSARHHQDSLRANMGKPSCKSVDSGKGNNVKIGNNAVWASYIGGYDRMSADANLGHYTHSYQGGMLGAEHSFSCSVSAGLAVAYENGLSRTDATRVESDSCFVDLYAVATTGAYTHRANLGFGTTGFDTRRGVSALGTATGDADATSFTVGYELSRSFELSTSSALTHFVSVDYTHHSFDTVSETGLGDANLSSDLDEVDQLTVGIGARYAKQFALIAGQEAATFTAGVALNAEIGAHTTKATNRFASYGNAFEVRSSERDAVFGSAELGLNIPFAKQWSGNAGAGVEFGGNRTNVSGTVGVRHTF